MFCLPQGSSATLRAGWRDTVSLDLWSGHQKLMFPGLGFCHLPQSQAWVSGRRNCQFPCYGWKQGKEGGQRAGESRLISACDPGVVTCSRWLLAFVEVSQCSFPTDVNILLSPQSRSRLQRALSVATLWSMTNADGKAGSAFPFLKEMKDI